MLNEAQRKWTGRKGLELLKFYLETSQKVTRREREDVWEALSNFINKQYTDSKKNSDVLEQLGVILKALDVIEQNLYKES